MEKGRLRVEGRGEVVESGRLRKEGKWWKEGRVKGILWKEF